jgi:hypothetical protein
MKKVRVPLEFRDSEALIILRLHSNYRTWQFEDFD